MVSAAFVGSYGVDPLFYPLYFSRLRANCGELATVYTRARGADSARL